MATARSGYNCKFINNALQHLAIEGVEITERHISVGLFGTVVEGTWVGAPCAIKRLRTQDATEYLSDRFLYECTLWSELKHPNVLQFYGLHFPIKGGYPVIVTELLQHNLDQYLKTTPKPAVPLTTKASILRDVALAVRYLHSRKPATIFRDLNASFVYLTPSLKAKLGEFGTATKLGRDDNDATDDYRLQRTETLPITGSSTWPEPYSSFASDAFSFGDLILHILLHAFPEPNPKIRRGGHAKGEVLGELQRREKYLMPLSNLEKIFQPILAQCYEDDPKARPSFTHLCTSLETVLCHLSAASVDSTGNARGANPSQPQPRSKEDRGQLTLAHLHLANKSRWPSQPDITSQLQPLSGSTRVHTQVEGTGNPYNHTAVNCPPANGQVKASKSSIPRRFQSKSVHSPHSTFRSPDSTHDGSEATNRAFHPATSVSPSPHSTAGKGSTHWVGTLVSPTSTSSQSTSRSSGSPHSTTPSSTQASSSSSSSSSRCTAFTSSGPAVSGVSIPIATGSRAAIGPAPAGSHRICGSAPSGSNATAVSRSGACKPQMEHFTYALVRKDYKSLQKGEKVIISPGAWDSDNDSCTVHRESTSVCLHVQPASKYLEALKPITDEVWFSQMCRDEAEEHMQKEHIPDGSYLVRRGGSDGYVLSVKYSGRAHLFQILYDADQMYSLNEDGEPRFVTISELVREYTKQRMGLAVLLTIPYISLRMELSRKSFSMEKELHQGKRFVVWIGKYATSTGANATPVAVKTVAPDEDQRRANMAALYNEASILNFVSRSGGHKNILKMFGIYVQKHPPHLIVELCYQDNMQQVVSQHAELYSNHHLMHFASQIASAMAFLEDKDIVHRELKAANVLLSNDADCKLSGFHCAVTTTKANEAFTAKEYAMVSNPRWTAPEVYTADPQYTSKSDVWSFGMVLVELFTQGCEPYHKIKDQNVKVVITNGTPPDIPYSCPHNIQSLIKRCVQSNPSQRPSFKDVGMAFA